MAWINDVLFITWFAFPMIHAATVNLFSLCGDGRSVKNAEKLTVLINGDHWPAEEKTCTVVFRSENGRSTLSYNFTRFEMDNFNTEISITTKYNTASFKSIYNNFMKPEIGKLYPALRALTVVVEREHVKFKGVNVSLDLITGKSQQKEETGPSGVAQKVGLTVGAVFGIVTCLTVMTLLDIIL